MVLREADEQTDVGAWQRLMDAARDAYVSIDAEGQVVDWNRRAQELFGWSPEEARGRLLGDMIVPTEFQEAHRLGLRRFSRTGRGNVAFQRLRLPAVDRDGRRFDVEFTILPTPVADGGWRFHAFLRDVTAERLSGGYLMLLQRAAVAANAAGSVEEAVRSTLGAIREVTDIRLAHAWLVADRDAAGLRPTGWWFPGPLEPFSGATMATTFVPGEGLPGRVVQSGDPTWVADLEADADFPRAAAAVEAGLRSAFAFPVSVADRVVAVIELFTKAAAEPNDELLQVMATVGTQLGRVFEREAAVTELQRVADDRQAIVSIVGHELRGPLGAAHASLGMLSDLVADGQGEVDEVLAVVDRQLGRVRRLADALVTAQRIQAGSLLVHRQPTAIAATVDEVVRDGQFTDVRNGVPAGVQVLVDPDHLPQLLWNLLANAARHGAPPVEVDATPVGGAVEIEVRDHGPGVPPEARDQLFGRFARGPGSPGTGLGLSIVRGLAEANGGAAAYRPGTDGGATFILRLPRA